ncbi:MAG: MoaD/ThiS family protein [Clostridia bacterium]|nr:MoaD/ThiS family protein [Candidatus Limimonas egerieequi]MCQ2489034.1 MoaD/ThiS family protein [Clostridia bacterium]
MIKVKMFGVVRLGSGVKEFECSLSEAPTVSACFDVLNIKSAPGSDKFTFGDSQVFVNHTRTTKKNFALKDGDEVWLMSPAAGG